MDYQCTVLKTETTS